MKYAVDENEVEEIQKLAAHSRSRRDEQDDNREITLGGGSLLGIFFGMVLICGIFFGLGYSVGRGSLPRVISQPAVTPGAPLAASQQPKPSPDQSSLATPVDNSLTPATSPANGATAASATSSTTPGTLPAPGAAPAAPQTAAAQPATPPAAQPTSAAPISTPAISPVSLQARQSAPQPVAMQPAAVTPSMGTYMVQVAAVRLQEDATVLVTALGNRGYKAVVRHTPQDSLLHVQLGPFLTRAQAMAMRSRLLADGYNAVVKQ